MMSTLTRNVASLLLVVPMVIGLTLRPAEADDDRSKDAARFAGEWRHDTFEWGKLKLSVYKPSGTAKLDNSTMLLAEGSQLIIKGDGFDYVFHNMVAYRAEKGTFSIVKAERDHFWVDVSATERYISDLGRPPTRKIVRKELWRLTAENKLQRCFPDEHTGERPKNFTPKEGDGVCLITFEKVVEKPAVQKK